MAPLAWLRISSARCASPAASLTSIDGMSSLSSVDGDLVIHSNYDLCQDDAEAFAAAITVGGTVSVYGNLGECE